MYASPSPAMSPAPPFQPVEVPANMRAFETVHGQVFPVMKGEEACAPSNASSESGATFSTQKAEEQVPAYIPEEKQAPQKLPPPGFGNSKPRARPQPAKREPKRPETVNYAQAASKRLAPETFKRTVRTKSTPIRVENPSRQVNRGPPLRRAQVREPRKPMTQTQPRRGKRKFGFRSKQNKIDKVFEALCKKYSDLGILASKTEVLRGEDTIRLHVKKFRALNRILEAVERESHIKIKKVSIPLSMKNQFQKKGFLVYTQVEDVSMVDEAKRIFQQFEEFKKCEVARQSAESSKALDEQPVIIVEESETSVDTFAEPGAYAIKSNDVQQEGYQEEEEIYGEADELCGSVDPLSLEDIATGSPTISPVDDLFGEKDGCMDLDLTIPAFTPRISLGG